jgi:flagellar hook-associated protein 2
MSKFFTADVADANQDGLAVRMKDFTSGLLATGGTFSTKDETLKNALQAQHGRSGTPDRTCDSL